MTTLGTMRLKLTKLISDFLESFVRPILAARLSHLLDKNYSDREIPKKTLIFLKNVLPITLISRGNLEKISPILIRNIEVLDSSFPHFLRDYLLEILPKINIFDALIVIKPAISEFSSLIAEFPLGDKANNLEIFINVIETVSQIDFKVLELLSQSKNDLVIYLWSQQWAMTQNNKAAAYLDRIRGDKFENIEKAIVACKSALEVRSFRAFPRQWAMTQHNLGIAYRKRILGERSENIELSIKAFNNALEVRTFEEFSQDWAETQNNLGIAYRNRIRGNQAENLEQAIICYQNSLRVYTRETFPRQWARVQENLAVAYSDRVYGSRFENIERSLLIHQAVLEVYTQEEFPEEWARTQHNLASTYGQCIDEDTTENLQKSVNAFKTALEIRTRQNFPEAWADTRLNLGILYSSYPLKENNENLELAISAYQAALEIYTLEAFPRNFAILQGNLGFTYQAFRRPTSAYNSFDTAINTVEVLRGEINFGSGSEEDKQKLAEEWNSLYQGMVEVCMEQNQVTKALEYAELSKTRNLVELILTRDHHTIFPTEVVAQLDRLRDEIASSQDQLQNATAEDPTALAQHLQQLRQQRNELQDRYLSIGSGFRFDPFRLTLSDRTAIVEFYITNDRLLVFIVTHQTQQPIILSPDLIDLKKLANWANNYLNAYSNKKSHWQHRLTTRLNLLAKILHIDEIIQQIPTECNQLILIPHRYLHLMPLHALSLAGNSSLFDRFPGGVSYAPSCQLLQLSQTRQRPDFTHLFAVQNPTGDLTYTDIEVETIQSYFSNSNLLKQKIATREAIDDTSLTTVHCAHFSCHGYFNTTQPRKSALILANAQLNYPPTQPDTENYLSLENGGILNLNKCLTLDSIFTLNLEQCRLVTLSACETGLIDFQNSSDEYIGLPSGFLYAGASSVVSSLWTVNDLSTAFLMIRFYQNLQKGLAVALALKQAQLWLKDLTKEDLKTWIAENQLPLNPTVRMNLRRRVYQLEDTKPFQSPFYWAAFCAIGE
ncbi:MAG: CHAT domain-containing tetratricopeptide repeat protein [Scytonema sp. PMC 1069.18]|nr:CHAT domain-containing tetratricopeptide repeat protein [Scytonema sp. PMC 1069.18]MEC4887041.1 CHAT domain-containing tetratricopeptide repeat protein [Scytonema sp. PMC 1070.18]